MHGEGSESFEAEGGLWQTDFKVVPMIPTSRCPHPHIIPSPGVWDQPVTCFQPIDYGGKGDELALP